MRDSFKVASANSTYKLEDVIISTNASSPRMHKYPTPLLFYKNCRILIAILLFYFSANN